MLCTRPLISQGQRVLLDFSGNDYHIDVAHLGSPFIKKHGYHAAHYKPLLMVLPQHLPA